MIIWGMGSAYERRRYIAKPHLIGWAHTQNCHRVTINLCAHFRISKYEKTRDLRFLSFKILWQNEKVCLIAYSINNDNNDWNENDIGNDVDSIGDNDNFD